MAEAAQPTAQTPQLFVPAARAARASKPRAAANNLESVSADAYANADLGDRFVAEDDTLRIDPTEAQRLADARAHAAAAAREAQALEEAVARRAQVRAEMKATAQARAEEAQARLAETRARQEASAKAKACMQEPPKASAKDADAKLKESEKHQAAMEVEHEPPSLQTPMLRSRSRNRYSRHDDDMDLRSNVSSGTDSTRVPGSTRSFSAGAMLQSTGEHKFNSTNHRDR